MSQTISDSYHELSALAGTDLSNANDVRQAALKLESILLNEQASQSPDLTQALGQKVLSATDELYEKFETDLELEFATKIQNGEVGIEEYPLFERFQRLISKEIDVAGIRPNSRILFIGSGPLPISPILFHKMTGGARVDCFDFSEEAYEVSQQVLDKLNLSDSIKVHHIKGEEAELPTVSTPGDINHNIVVVALLAQPKEKIVSRIVLSQGPHCKIIMRTSEGSRRALYKGVDKEKVLERSFSKSPGFEVIGEYHADVDDTISGIVMVPTYTPWVHRI